MEILRAPFIPSEFGTNKGGMQAGEPLSGRELDQARGIWRAAMMFAIMSALGLMFSKRYVKKMRKGKTFEQFVRDASEGATTPDKIKALDPKALNVSKGLLNRLIEPFMFHKVIITVSVNELNHFLALRLDEQAQLEIRTAAKLMKDALDSATPTQLEEGEWHLPYLKDEEREWAKANPLEARKVVTARCARVSYLTHGAKKDGTFEEIIAADVARADDLASSGHMSPFEHAAMPIPKAEWEVRTKAKKVYEEALEAGLISPEAAALSIDQQEFAGNFRGFVQFRREIPYQSDFSKVPQPA